MEDCGNREYNGGILDHNHIILEIWYCKTLVTLETKLQDIQQECKDAIFKKKVFLKTVATLGSILDTQLSWESNKFQLARWSHKVVLFLVRTNRANPIGPNHPTG